VGAETVVFAGVGVGADGVPVPWEKFEGEETTGSLLLRLSCRKTEPTLASMPRFFVLEPEPPVRPAADPFDEFAVDPEAGKAPYSDRPAAGAPAAAAVASEPGVGEGEGEGEGAAAGRGAETAVVDE
jgi:hypothetical protein